MKWFPWLAVSGKTMLASSSLWLLVMSVAFLPPLWSAFSPWAITPRMSGELSGLAALLGSAWGVHHASTLGDLWRAGGSIQRLLAPFLLILIPATILQLVAHLAQAQGETVASLEFWISWFSTWPSVLVLAMVARCVINLPARSDLLTGLWVLGGWALATAAEDSIWISEFAWDNSRLRHPDNSETAKSYAQGSLIPILGWAMLTWAVCVRTRARLSKMDQAEPAGPNPR